MKIIFYLIIFVFGLVVGSFLNCVIYRLEKKKSFLKGRSFCPHCCHFLSWKDLIPVLSFLILRGRCRYCGKKISVQYPLVEISTGLLFLLIALSNSQFSFFLISDKLLISNCHFLVNLFYLLIICSFLVIIFVYDLKHFIIPDKIVYPAVIIVLIYRLLGVLSFNHWNLFEWRLKIENWNFLLHPLLAAAGASAFFLGIVLFSRGRWMGMGDVKMAFLMGLLLGFPSILAALFFAFFVGAIIGIGLILAKKRTLKSEVPFGPFLTVGTFIALLWGQKIVNWYLSLFKI